MLKLLVKVILFLCATSFAEKGAAEYTSGDKNLDVVNAILWANDINLENKIEMIKGISQNLDSGFIVPTTVSNNRPNDTPTVGQYLAEQLTSNLFREAQKVASSNISELDKAESNLQTLRFEKVLEELKKINPNSFSNIDGWEAMIECEITGKWSSRCNIKNIAEILNSDLKNSPGLEQLMDREGLRKLFEPVLNGKISAKASSNNNPQIPLSGQNGMTPLSDEDKKKLKCQLDALQKWEQVNLNLIQDMKRKPPFHLENHFIAGSQSSAAFKSKCVFQRFSYQVLGFNTSDGKQSLGAKKPKVGMAKKSISIPDKDYNVKFVLLNAYLIDEKGFSRSMTNGEFQNLISEFKKTNAINSQNPKLEAGNLDPIKNKPRVELNLPAATTGHGDAQ